MRVTCETLASGQPRPYADSIRHVRVMFEIQNWDSRPGAPKWIPWKNTDEACVREILRHMMVGFTDAEPEGWWSTRLDYLRPVEGQDGIWEFHTTTPFTD